MYAHIDTVAHMYAHKVSNIHTQSHSQTRHSVCLQGVSLVFDAILHHSDPDFLTILASSGFTGRFIQFKAARGPKMTIRGDYINCGIFT